MKTYRIKPLMTIKIEPDMGTFTYRIQGVDFYATPYLPMETTQTPRLAKYQKIRTSPMTDR